MPTANDDLKWLYIAITIVCIMWVALLLIG